MGGLKEKESAEVWRDMDMKSFREAFHMLLEKVKLSALATIILSGIVFPLFKLCKFPFLQFGTEQQKVANIYL